MSGAQKGRDDNLRPDFERPFAGYLVRVVDAFQHRHGITLRKVSPVTEPNTGYWFAKNTHEGAHWAPALQAMVIDATDAAFTRCWHAQMVLTDQTHTDGFVAGTTVPARVIAMLLRTPTIGKTPCATGR